MNKEKEREFDVAAFDARAAEWRYVITDIICRAGSGHLGGALSLVEVMLTLYQRVMRYDPANPLWAERDRLVLSKGHAAPVLYVALADAGFFPAEWLGTLNADGTKLPSHADARFVPGVDFTTGSLGQGLSAASGMAWAAKTDGAKHTVYCLVGDGELNEGQNWEAAMFASHNKLDNLVAIMDYNRLQIDGYTEEIMGLEPLADKWRSFGWHVLEVDGHSWDELYNAFESAREVTGKPVFIIANTIKGKGCSLIENKPESHNIKVPDAESHQKYLAALDIKSEITLKY
ncbi:MAG: transketolase [Lentisphaerae bacterium]|jgi:transketolase|nr:transketolase [Lentisphaerota bacterium]